MSRRANKNRQVRPQVLKPRKHETLEDRVVMSADPLLGPIVGLHESPVVEVPIVIPHDLGPSLQLPVMDMPASEPDFWIDPQVSAELALDELDRMVDTMLREGHALTGQDDVVNRYGFTGAGQTVAVIDTGIAYNHYALGGGMGSGYRVVGGWDFAEGDADFNDDSGNSKAGHGTHVAGIVGASSDSPHNGVATGVDLVGLRVFDDAGAGYFSWIEQALQWVHTNRDAYDSPITTVNLSLGTTWNSDDNPGWAMLENEFAQLEADGIFISVSAGNSYEDFNANGVSYPASSDYVIPVMATKDDGSLAYFSQRATYAIGAPGWGITSTVPDHNGNDSDSIDDDWGVKYGTSMAAPYLAGASTLVREAMEFVGQTGIDQWDIYDHIMETADSFYDSTSSTNYKRLNLEAAIDALMPVDDHGTSVDTASNLGTLGEGTSSTSGVISTLDDGDYFTFTAGVSGVVTVSATNTTHDLTASWDAWGGEWSAHENGCQIDVVAGETYTVALSTSNGLGHYDLQVEVEAVETFTPVEWGSINAQVTRTWQPTAGEEWFRVTAGRTGYFTAETLPDSGSATVAIYDAGQNLLTAAGSRADFHATAGQTLLLRVTGDAPSYDMRMTNALSVAGGVATLVGTTGADAVDFVAGDSSHTVSLNEVSYTIADSAVTSIQITGDGADTLSITGSSTTESFELTSTGASFSRDSLSLSATGISSVVATAGSVNDSVVLRDSAGDDTLTAYSDRVLFAGNGFSNDARGFSSTTVYATTGTDRATLRDSAGDDTLTAWSSRAVIAGTGFSNDVRGFDSVTAHTSTGVDRAHLYDTAGDEVLTAWSDRAVMNGTGFFNDARGFDQVTAYASSGTDRAYVHGTAGAETFTAWSDRSVLSGTGFFNDARGFDQVTAYGYDGADRAFFHDTSGVDTFSAWSDRAVMTGVGYFNDARGFVQATAYSTGDADQAHLHDTAGDDRLSAWSDRAVMFGDGYFNDVRDFARVTAYATTGTDRAALRDSAGDDTLSAWSDRVNLAGDGYVTEARAFDQVTAYASGGHDKAYMYDTAGNDVYTAWATRSVIAGSGFFNDIRDFEHVIATATTGFDRSYLHDTAGNDVFSAWSDRAVLASSGFFNDARGFDQVKGYADNGGYDRAYLHGTDGDDHLVAQTGLASLSSPAALAEAHSFDRVTAYSETGDDTSSIDGVLDYVLATEGSWA